MNKINKGSYINCDNCGKRITQKDTVIAVQDSTINGHYCSRECLDKNLLINEYVAEYYMRAYCDKDDIKEEK